jgi:hypothetical protein
MELNDESDSESDNESVGEVSMNNEVEFEQGGINLRPTCKFQICLPLICSFQKWNSIYLLEETSFVRFVIFKSRKST